MEPLVALIALVVLAIPLTLIALVVGHRNLRRRLGEAETEIRHLQGKLSDLQTDRSTATDAAPKPLMDESPTADPEAAPPETSSDVLDQLSGPPPLAVSSAGNPKAAQHRSGGF